MGPRTARPLIQIKHERGRLVRSVTTADTETERGIYSAVARSAGQLRNEFRVPAGETVRTGCPRSYLKRTFPD